MYQPNHPCHWGGNWDKIQDVKIGDEHSQLQPILICTLHIIITSYLYAYLVKSPLASCAAEREEET